MSGKEFLRGSLRDTVRERELEVFGDELFDVWTLDIGRLLDLDDFQDLAESGLPLLHLEEGGNDIRE